MRTFVLSAQYAEHLPAERRDLAKLWSGDLPLPPRKSPPPTLEDWVR
jgi:hypothetical protein